MKIAIIGAGLSGLSLAWKLLQTGRCEVTLFDSQGIGGGASGVASGLLHPYPGEQAKRSWRASEALAATLRMLREVEGEEKEGIVRVVSTAEQRAVFERHAMEYGDVEQITSHSFLIRSGVTVHCDLYLTRLWQKIASLGGTLEKQKVTALEELKAWDTVVIAAGAGVAHFPECKPLALQLIKGQVLTVKAPEGFPPLEQSVIGKGYVALDKDPGLYHLGSTYERIFSSDAPSLEATSIRLLPKISCFFPDAAQWTPFACRAGVRVARIGHYWPIVHRLNATCWVFTALGSRGLLYHAYLAEYLKEAILAQDASLLPQEMDPILEKAISLQSHARC